MKIIIFVFTACSGKTVFLQKNHKNSISYFSKMDKNKCPFLKNGLYSFLDFCVFIIINYFNINNCIDNYIYGR